ncbi:MAG: hypothetical protein QNJ54_25390 [Prochloraceae cyanobacterium]|nr:hypothetical protein [Prochloraceae cyanobacterium]
MAVNIKTDEATHKRELKKKKAARAAAKALRIYEGESKTERFSIKLTPRAKQGIEDLADSLGLSQAELIEQIGRGKIRVEPVDDSAA